MPAFFPPVSIRAAMMLEAVEYESVLEYREGIAARLDAGGPVVTRGSRVSVRAEKVPAPA